MVDRTSFWQGKLGTKKRTESVENNYRPTRVAIQWSTESALSTAFLEIAVTGNQMFVRGIVCCRWTLAILSVSTPLERTLTSKYLQLYGSTFEIHVKSWYSATVFCPSWSLLRHTRQGHVWLNSDAAVVFVGGSGPLVGPVTVREREHADNETGTCNTWQFRWIATCPFWMSNKTAAIIVLTI
jgi:hypothetical protein